MAKSNMGMFAVIIVIIIIGAGTFAYIYLYTDLLSGEEQKKKKNEETDENKAPIAFFKFENGSTGRVGDLLFFDANGSRDPDGEISRYEWYFGDGGKAFTNGTKVNHTYLSPGTYDVNLTVVDNEGGRGTLIKPLTIRQTDYTVSGVQILLSREPGGISSELNATIPVDEEAVSFTLEFSFMGAAISGTSINPAELEVELYNPIGEVVDRKNQTTRINEVTMDINVTKTDLAVTGEWEMIARCTEGSLRLDYRIEVLY
jgi:PKD repeat protein